MVSIEQFQLILTLLGPISFGLTYLIVKALRNLIQNIILGAGSVLINEKIKEIMQHPELFDPIVGKILSRFAEKPVAGGKMKIMGYTVPDFLQPIIGDFIKKGAQKFLPELGEGQNEQKSPFG